MFAQFIISETQGVNKALFTDMLLETFVYAVFLCPAIQIYGLPTYMAT